MVAFLGTKRYNFLVVSVVEVLEWLRTNRELNVRKGQPMNRQIYPTFGILLVLCFFPVSKLSAQISTSNPYGSALSALNLPNARGRIFNNPSVSPYLSLLNNNDVSSGIPSYFTSVRPRLEQRAAREQQDRQIKRLQTQTSSLRRDISRAGQQGGAFATGHPTRFGNYLHFYPSLGR